MDKKDNYIIIGTAGHIDHGKTALVKALTGRDTDTLNEEIRRGITINLGFTWLGLKSGARAGLIDVPGHERFVKNMIAGAAGVDMALLVVAANEGIKPQTLEHLDILCCLGLTEGVIVLTKCSLADETMTELVKQDIEEAVKGTFLEGADIVHVDSVTREGIEELKELLDSRAGRVSAKNSASPARLNVDRVFTKKGFGTVVTGTVMEGVIRQNDELSLYPKDVSVKIRGVQVHEAAAAEAAAGQRAALNISGVRLDEVFRGDVLSETGAMRMTRLLDVKIRLFKRSKRSVKFWERLRLYIGAREIFCRAVPLSGNEIAPGDEDFCQLRLEEDLFCKKDDRFVVRFYSPLETIGGGVVIDPCPKKHSKMDDTLFNILNIKESGKAREIVGDYIRNSAEGSGFKEIRAYAGVGEEEAEDALDELVNDEVIVRIGNRYFHSDNLEKIRDKALKVLSDFHAVNPLRRGMPKEALKSKLTGHMKPKELDGFLRIMADDGLIRNTDGAAVATRDFEVALTAVQRQIKKEIEEALLHGGFMPPSAAELTRGEKRRSEVLELSEEVVFLDKQTVIHAEFYNKAKDKTTDFLSKNGEITLAAFRDLISSSRKYAQLLLEKFDDERLTVRVNDIRKLVKGARE